MRKGDPRYTITDRRRLFPEKGTEVVVKPLLPVTARRTVYSNLT